MKRIISKLFLFTGLISTFTALMIVIGNFQLAILNLSLFLLYVFQIIYRKRIVIISRDKVAPLILFIIFFVSSFGSIKLLPKIWYDASIVASLKFIFILMPLIFLFSDRELLYYRKNFFKGLLISAWCQLIWEIAQVIMYYGAHISLNQIIFGNLMGINSTHTWTFVSNNLFRPSGISWEPANLGLTLVIGFILTKRIIGKVSFSIGIILSTSLTGILLLFICIIISALLRMKHSSWFIGLKWNTIWSIYIAIFFTFISIMLLSSKVNILNIINSIADRISSGIGNGDSSANQHINYYWQAFSILTYSSPFEFLFGYGTGVAGFPFTKYFGVFSWIYEPWNPETDFVTVLIGNGVIGCLVYYICLIKCVILNKNNYNFYMIALMIIIGGFSYVYVRSSWTLLICLMLLIKNRVGLNVRKNRKISPNVI